MTKILSIIAAAACLFCAAIPSMASPFEEGVTLLTEKQFDKKAAAIDKLVQSGDERSPDILQHLLDGRLYYVKKGKTLVFGQPEDNGMAIRSALTGESMGSVKKRKLRKVSINNELRGHLKTVLAGIDLSHRDKDRRLAAVNKMMASLTPKSARLLSDRYAVETDAEVKEALAVAIAITDLHHADPALQAEAIKRMTGSLHPAVRNALTRFIASGPEPALERQARKALAAIDERIALYGLVETVFFGLSLGSVLVLAAIGLAITFGVIGVINMAHGELIMLGAYTTYVMQQLLPGHIGLAVILSIPAAFAVSGLVGIVIEKAVIRFLYGRPLETLLATFGLSLILQQAVRTIFSPLNRSVATPSWMSGSIRINAVLSLTTNRVAILVFSMLIFAGLFAILKKSTMGLQVRAVSQNRPMARAMGVRTARVDALTFGLGSGIAGIAGVALSQLTNVGPNLGQAYIVDSFMVVVFGGVGNLWGTLLGGLTLGVANKFLEPWTGAVLAKILILLLIILFIQKRPQGLFPQRGRAAT